MSKFQPGMYSAKVLDKDANILFRRVYYVTREGEVDAHARSDAEAAKVHPGDIAKVEIATFDGKW